MRFLIATSNSSELMPKLFNDINNVKRYIQYKSLFVTVWQYNVFAEPESIQQLKIKWYGEVNAHAVRYIDLMPEQQEIARSVLKRQVKELYNAAFKIIEQHKTQENLFAILEYSLEIPDYSDILVHILSNSQYKIYLINWGHIKSEFGAEIGLIKKMFPIKIKDMNFHVSYKDGIKAVNETISFTLKSGNYTLLSDNHGLIVLSDVPFYEEILAEQKDVSGQLNYSQKFICRSIDDYYIVLPQFSKMQNLRINVIDSNNIPLSDIKFSMHDGNTILNLISDNDGKILVNNIVPNSKIIFLLLDSDFDDFEYELEQVVTENLTFRLNRKLVNLLIKVKYTFEKPIENCKIIVNSPIKSSELKTTGDGTALFGDLEKKSKVFVHYKYGLFASGKREIVLSDDFNILDIVLQRLKILPYLKWILIVLGGLLLTYGAYSMISSLINNDNFSQSNMEAPKEEFDDDELTLSSVYISGWLIGERADVNLAISKIFTLDMASEILGEGKYSDNSKVFPKAIYFSLDGIAVGVKTKIIIFSQRDFRGDTLLNVSGPMVINNILWYEDENYRNILNVTYDLPFNTIFPISKRIWSSTDMTDWHKGSMIIESN